MNNIAKHSQADLVRLALGKKENGIGWVIRDNGGGSDSENMFSSEGQKEDWGAHRHEGTNRTLGSDVCD
jgi:signal transduction histidine kinase